MAASPASTSDPSIPWTPRPHCTCMSGLTDAELKLMNLHGALAVVEWLTVEAQFAVCGPAPTGSPDLYERLIKLQGFLVKAQQLCLDNAFPLSRRGP